MKNELPAPPAAETAERAMEIFRGWIIDDALAASMYPKTWHDEPENWGRFLSDIAQLVSGVLAQETGRDAGELLALFRKVFNEELDALEKR
jgi:hypothetical protein